MSIYNSTDNFDQVLNIIELITYKKSKLAQNIRYYLEKNMISVVVPNADIDQGSCDGTILIQLINISYDDVINHIIGASNADEISIDGNILRLWWD
jgi:hypothetical protein